MGGTSPEDDVFDYFHAARFALGAHVTMHDSAVESATVIFASAISELPLTLKILQKIDLVRPIR